MTTPVCVITNAYPDFEGSYHGIFVLKTVRDMAGRGWESHVLAPRIFSKSTPFESFPTHTVTRFRFPTAEKLLIEYETIPAFRIGALVAGGILAAARLIRSRGCRLVHAHWALPAGLIGLAAARLTGRELILTVHGSDWRLAKERGGIAALLFKLAARGASRVIGVSTEITDYLLRLGLAEENVIGCPMGADERLFNNKVQPDPVLSGGFPVISTRNLTPLYRVGDLIEAATRVSEKVPDLKLLIAGDGSQGEALKQLCFIRGLDDRVTFYGRVEPERLAVLLASSRVYLSTSPAEGSSVSLLEAMACGCLPVVTDIPANREWIVHGDNGLLFPPGDVEALTLNLLRAAGDDILAAKAAARGPAIVAERGLWSRQIETLDSCYKKLCLLRD